MQKPPRYYLERNDQQHCWELKEATPTPEPDTPLARFYDSDEKTVTPLGRTLLAVYQEKKGWNLGMPLSFVLVGVMTMGFPALIGQSQSSVLGLAFNILGFLFIIIGVFGGCIEIFNPNKTV